VKRSLYVVELLLTVWLLFVLADYFGLIVLPGLIADAAAITFLILVGTMIWKYFIRSMFRARSEQR
jgi:hypothetical protein